MTSTLDLHQIVVVNESKSASVAGHLDIFRDRTSAQEYLEPWWVTDQEGFAFTAAGEPLDFVVDHGRVLLKRAEGKPAQPDLVRAWLEAFAAHVRGNAGSAVSVPKSIEELVDCIGFSR